MKPINGSIRHFIRAAASCAALSVSSPVLAQADNSSVLSLEQKTAIERLIRDYIVKNPDVLLEAQAALEARAETQRVDTIRKHLLANRDAIYRDPGLPIAGNPNGDVTVVEFMDYNCPYCKKASADIAKMIAADPNVKVVFQEFANLQPASEAVARVAIAANRQGRYYELHRALMDAKGSLTEARALDIAGKLGLDLAQLKRDAAAESARATVVRAKALAARLGIEGTPMFLIGDRYISGVPDDFADQLKQLAAEVRKSGCAVC